jgi:hypothetical protein
MHISRITSKKQISLLTNNNAKNVINKINIESLFGLAKAKHGVSIEDMENAIRTARGKRGFASIGLDAGTNN